MDYDEALQTGMAITATDGDMSAGTLADGLDALVVLGVDWSRDPEAAAGALNAQLTAKRASDGSAFMAAGTPTNNTGEAPAGDDAAAALDPFDAAPPAGPESAGRRAERAPRPKEPISPPPRIRRRGARRRSRPPHGPRAVAHHLGVPGPDHAAVGRRRRRSRVRTHRVTGAVAGRCPRSASVASPTACSRWSPPRPGREDDPWRRRSATTRNVRAVWDRAVATILVGDGTSPRTSWSGSWHDPALEELPHTPGDRGGGGLRRDRLRAAGPVPGAERPGDARAGRDRRPPASGRSDARRARTSSCPLCSSPTDRCPRLNRWTRTTSPSSP